MSLTRAAGQMMIVLVALCTLVWLILIGHRRIKLLKRVLLV